MAGAGEAPWRWVAEFHHVPRPPARLADQQSIPDLLRRLTSGQNLSLDTLDTLLRLALHEENGALIMAWPGSIGACLALLSGSVRLAARAATLLVNLLQSAQGNRSELYGRALFSDLISHGAVATLVRRCCGHDGRENGSGSASTTAASVKMVAACADVLTYLAMERRRLPAELPQEWLHPQPIPSPPRPTPSSHHPIPPHPIPSHPATRNTPTPPISISPSQFHLRRYLSCPIHPSHPHASASASASASHGASHAMAHPRPHPCSTPIWIAAPCPSGSHATGEAA